jgi:hypothetical protein
VVETKFPIEVGQSLKKAYIHALIGGSSQHAMTSCLGGSAFLVFHDPLKGRKFGYDVWEGPQADGSFHYTGQGVLGHQRLTGPNRILLAASSDGKPIHFFRRPGPGSKRVPGNPYTYEGLVMLDVPPYVVREAPDQTGALRNVFVFRFVPLEESPDQLASSSKSLAECAMTPWNPSIADIAKLGIPTTPAAQADLEENKLQKRFWEFMCSKGEQPERAAISIDGLKGYLFPDFVLSSRGLVVEAKPSTSRIHVRLAIGQVLDYAHLLAEAGRLLKPAILLPGKPRQDLCDLLEKLEISLIFESSPGEFLFV